MADLSQRIAAKIIDWALVLVLASIFAVQWKASHWLGFFMMGMDMNVVRSGPFSSNDLSSIGGLALVLLFICQYLLLTCEGQTIGKKALSIRIVDEKTGKSGGFSQNVLWRSWVNHFLSLIPFYFLVDVLLILRDDRRCAHDLLAGTRVVKT